LTGVLSLLDVILHLPAPTLVDALGLTDDIKIALLEHKGPYAELLQLAEASEQDQAEGILDLCTNLGIDPGMLSHVQNEALIWARSQIQSDAEGPTFVNERPKLAIQQNQAPDEQQAFSDDALFDTAKPDESAALCALGDRYATGEGVTQDFPKSLACYTKAAEQGNAKAQWNVAVMHSHGQGCIKRDLQLAAQWCQKAAEQAFAPAQATLGMMYATGQGVERNVQQAMALFEQAGLSGDTEAQYNLAAFHEQGLAGEKNLDQALVWFSKAAEHGLPAAQERLGLMYAIGQPMKQDLIEAYKWFSLASASELDTATANLAHCLTLMDADQITEANSRASLWMQGHMAVRANISKRIEL
jgi:TPR repeat protein